MKYLISFLFFIHLNAFSAGDYETVDASAEYQKAEKLINNQKFEIAIDVLLDLIDEDPQGYTKADLYNYLGFASRKQSKPDYKLAENYYLKALEIDNNHIGALEYLGELYIQTNRVDEAKDLLARIKMYAGEDSEEFIELNKLITSF